MVIGRPGGRYHWQFMGEAEPHHTPGCSRPPQGVPAEVRAREVTRGLMEVARKEAREAREVARGLREVARKEGKKPGPGSRCPQWLATLMGSGGR